MLINDMHVHMRPILVQLFFWLTSTVVGWLVPPIVKAGWGINLDDIATQYATTIVGRTQTISQTQIQMWIVILILLSWTIYWLWLYRNVEIRWPSYHKKVSVKSETPKAISTKTLEAPYIGDEGFRNMIQSVASKKPRYAKPKDAPEVEGLSIKQLGDYLVEIGENLTSRNAMQIGHISSDKMLAECMKNFAPYFFHFYGAVKAKGLSDDYLERYYDKPEQIQNVFELAKHLIRYGNHIQIYEG